MVEFLQQLLNGLSQGGIYALIALGYTMVYGILRFINFAHGDVFMLGSFAGFYLGPFVLRLCGGTPSFTVAALTLALAMLGCALIGMLIERFCYKPLRHQPKITVLITAIGVSLLLENGGQLLFGADPKSFPELITDRALALANVIAQLMPAAFHNTEQYANNRVECDHGRLKARSGPMRGLKTDRTTRVTVPGHTFMQNLRRGHYELGTPARNRHLRIAAAFDELAEAV